MFDAQRYQTEVEVLDQLDKEDEPNEEGERRIVVQNQTLFLAVLLTFQQEKTDLLNPPVLVFLWRFHYHQVACHR